MHVLIYKEYMCVYRESKNSNQWTVINLKSGLQSCTPLVKMQRILPKVKTLKIYNAINLKSMYSPTLYFRCL